MAARVMFCAALALVAQAAAAQGLADPTRPPAVVAAPLPGAGDTPAGPVLQSVLRPRRGKPEALISGVRVPLGGRYGDARLIRLTENEAVLAGPEGLQRLALTPGIAKRPATTRKNAP